MLVIAILFCFFSENHPTIVLNMKLNLKEFLTFRKLYFELPQKVLMKMWTFMNVEIDTILFIME